MTRPWAPQALDPFDRGKSLGLTLPNVEAATKYDGSPVVLVRLSRIHNDALRDVLSVAWRLTLPKSRTRRRSG